MQQCKMWACKEFMWLSETDNMEKGVVAISSCLLYSLNHKLWRGLKNSKRGRLDHWAAPVGKISMCSAESFSYITENLCPAASPPRLWTSSKCINLKWSPLPPIEPSVLPVLCMSFTFIWTAWVCLYGDALLHSVFQKITIRYFSLSLSRSTVNLID